MKAYEVRRITRDEFNKIFDSWKPSNKIFTLKDVEKIQTKEKVYSSDIIFDANKDDKFVIEKVRLNDITIGHNKNLSLDDYKKLNMDEDIIITEVLIDKIDNNIDIVPIVVDENYEIMDGIHRYVAYKELKFNKIFAFVRI